MSLTDGGRAQAAVWADKLARHALAAVYSSGERSGIETAEILAMRCGARHHVAPALCELDIGLWEGLTPDMLKQRFPKTFKLWRTDPSGVRPPGGEAIDAATTRVDSALTAVTRRQPGRSTAVVLGPLVFGLARCVMESVTAADVWWLEHDEPLCYELDAVDARAVAPRRGVRSGR